MTQIEIWTYRELEVADIDLTGFAVEARDGEIGKVDEATYETGDAHLVVDTGGWIFGKKVLLPAGTVEAIDLEEERIRVDRTKDEIKDAPEWDAERSGDEGFRLRQEVGEYYAGGRARVDTDARR